MYNYVSMKFSQSQYEVPIDLAIMKKKISNSIINYNLLSETRLKAKF